MAADPSEEHDIEAPGHQHYGHGNRDKRALRAGHGGGGGYGYGRESEPFDVSALLAWTETNFGDGAAKWGPGATRHLPPNATSNNVSAPPLLNVAALLEL
jgi:hypothetical protein